MSAQLKLKLKPTYLGWEPVLPGCSTAVERPRAELHTAGWWLQAAGWESWPPSGSEPPEGPRLLGCSAGWPSPGWWQLCGIKVVLFLKLRFHKKESKQCSREVLSSQRKLKSRDLLIDRKSQGPFSIHSHSWRCETLTTSPEAHCSKKPPARELKIRFHGSSRPFSSCAWLTEVFWCRSI